MGKLTINVRKSDVAAADSSTAPQAVKGQKHGKKGPLEGRLVESCMPQLNQLESVLENCCLLKTLSASCAPGKPLASAHAMQVHL